MTEDDYDLLPGYKYMGEEDAIKAAIKEIEKDAMNTQFSLPHCAGLRAAVDCMKRHLKLVNPPEPPF
jgi:hypothetical protein